MQFALDILKKIIAYLPQVFNWWLYSPEKTKKNIEVIIHNKDGSLEFWCDEELPRFKAVIEFKNNNPFPIEIDRILISGSLLIEINGVYSQSVLVRAEELIGGKIKKYQKETFYLGEFLDKNDLKILNQAQDNPIFNLHIKAVIVNKYSWIRDFQIDLNRLMCKFVNKNLQKSKENSEEKKQTKAD